MKKKMRKTGIDILGDVSWGTHFCQFYQTKEDLIDILVPYFKTGLENNEFCIWVTSEPLRVKEAKAALKKRLKKLDNYIKKGQIEILDYNQWYTKTGMFEADKVLKGWVEKEKGAAERGFDGLRLNINTFWLEKRDWKDFADYEEKVNNVISQIKMLAICSYSVDRCGASEIIDVVGSHQFALVKREGKWVLIESSERKRVAEEAKRHRDEIAALNNVPVSISRHLELKPLLMSALKTTLEVLKADGGLIYLFDETSQAFAPVVSIGISQDMLQELTGFKIGEGLSGRVAKQQRPLVVPDLVADRRNISSAAIRKGWHSYAGIPIEFKRKVIGVMTLISYKRDYFQPEHLDLLRNVGRQIGPVIENSRLYEETKKMEEKYRDLVENINDVIYSVDRDGVIIYISPVIKSISGYSPSELVGRSFTEHIYHEDLPGFKEQFHQDISGHLEPSEYRILTKSGEVRWVRSSNRPVIIGKCVIGLQGVMVDISERKRTEEALRESEEKYRSLFDNMLEGFAYCKIIVDKNNKPVDFVYIEVNDAFEVLTGLKKELVTGNRITKIIPGIKKAHPELFKIYGKVALTGKPTNFDIYFEPLKIWLSISVYCPKKGYFVAVFDNITGRKQAEDALRESEARYRAIFEQAADSIVLVDAETGNLVDFNDKAHENLGYTRQEFEKLQISDFEAVESAEEVAKHIGKILKEGSDTFETKHRTKGGEIRNILVSSKAISISGRDFVQSIWRDITEKKRMEEEKERLHKQLIHAEKMAAVGTLTSGIAHEFNNLLQIMRGYTEFAQRTKKAKDMEEALDVVLNTSDEAAKIIADLLTFSKEDPSEKELCDITESIESTLSLIENQLKKHNIRVLRKYEKTPKILINKAEMQQVFLNIIANARDAMLPWGGRLEIRVRQVNENVEVGINDTGKGIEEENLSRVFEPFYTTKGTNGKNGKLQGTGLGLSVSYGIVKRHGGTIAVESKVGQGTTFTVKLAVDGTRTEGNYTEGGERRKRGITEPLNILAVDDEGEIGNMLAKWLSSERCRVKSVLTGRKALNLVRKEYFDIVFLDIVMPGIPAVEVLEKIKRISPTTEVVIMTGKIINKDLVSELKAKEASGFLQKPFRTGNIKRIIEDLR